MSDDTCASTYVVNHLYLNSSCMILGKKMLVQGDLSVDRLLRKVRWLLLILTLKVMDKSDLWSSQPVVS